MGFKTLLVSLPAVLAIANPAAAILRNYGVHWTTISQFNTTRPSSPNNYPPGKQRDFIDLQVRSVGIVDDPGNGNPVLKRLSLVTEFETTVDVPGCSGFVFLSSLADEGPKKKLNFTGTGSTTTSIAWGLVTGWTVTGGLFCHADFFPGIVCANAGGKDLETVDPKLVSSFYDLGTWAFHHTGFTSIPWVHQKASPASMSVGNSAYWVRGRLRAGLVPALPVLGVALLAASLLFAGARLSRKVG